MSAGVLATIIVLVPIVGFFASIFIGTKIEDLLLKNVNDENIKNARKKISHKISVTLLVLLCVVLPITLFVWGVNSDNVHSTSNKSEWSSMSEQEKDNARWAYEVQQGLKNN